jgi:hypothetical protein
MKSFKALISKYGEIMSIESLAEPYNDRPCLHVLPGSMYPDVVYASAAGKEEAEQKINDLLNALKALNAG